MESKDVLMMKFNRYPLNIEEYESTEVIMEVKNEIQLSIGDNNTDSRKKVVRILINLKENLRNNEEKLFDNDEETLRDFSMKIYYYFKIENDELDDMDNNYIVLFILKDLDKIIRMQTSITDKKSMNLQNAIDKFIEDNNLSHEEPLKILDSTI